MILAADRCAFSAARACAAFLLAASVSAVCAARPLANASEEPAAGRDEPVGGVAGDQAAAAISEASESSDDIIDDVFSSLGTVFEQTPGWAWLALFAGILGGLIAGKIVQSVFRRVGERLHAQAFNHRLFEAFGAAGIEFAFPTQTLYLAGDSSRELAVRVLPGSAEGIAN